MRIDSAGNVGIGTSSNQVTWAANKAGLLSVEQAATYTNLAVMAYTGAAGGTAGSILTLGRSRSGTVGTRTVTNSGDTLGVVSFEGVNSSSEMVGGAYIMAAQSAAAGASFIPADLRFFTATDAAAPTERMRIDSSGNLLVGTTSGGISSRVYAVNGGIAPGFHAQNTLASGYASTLFYGQVANAASGSFDFLGMYASTTVLRFRVSGAGDVQNTNNSYGAISDAKLKENVTDATPKLEKLNQVRVVNYNLIGEEQKQIGVIAQELEQIFPGMVDESPDRDKEGNDLGTTTKSVKYSVFVPMLIKAIQEQQAIIESLKTRIEALEGTQP
jgi:hypothetical protein